MKTQASAEAMVFSKSFANLRHRPSHAKVRSTTHRRGRTWKPLTLTGEVTHVHDDGTVTVRLHSYATPITTTGERLSLVAKRTEKAVDRQARLAFRLRS